MTCNDFPFGACATRSRCFQAFSSSPEKLRHCWSCPLASSILGCTLLPSPWLPHEAYPTNQLSLAGTGKNEGPVAEAAGGGERRDVRLLVDCYVLSHRRLFDVHVRTLAGATSMEFGCTCRTTRSSLRAHKADHCYRRRISTHTVINKVRVQQK